MLKGDSYDTQGILKRSYFDHSIFLALIETVKIVIDEKDAARSTSSNFIFERKILLNFNEQIFDGTIISNKNIVYNPRSKRIK